MDQTEIYDGFVVPEQVTATADADGLAILNLWPNALGVNGSSYRITARNPDTGKKFFDSSVVVPNNPCNLYQIIQNAPFPNVDSAQQALIDVQALVAIVNQDVLAADDDRVAAEIAAAQALTRSAAAALSQFNVGLSEIAVEADRVAVAANTATAAATKVQIDHKYRGALTADPATRTDGSANQAGDEYFYNGGLPNLLKRFNGATWQASDINTANLAAAGGAGMVGANAYQTQDSVNLERISVRRFGAVGNGVADDTAAFQATVNFLILAGGVLDARNGTWRINGQVIISTSNITVDGTGATFIGGGGSVERGMFRCTPASLIASGRYTGNDYPAAWKNGSTPLPFDGAFDAMMHENAPAQRLKNIAFLNITLDPASTREFLTAHSVDKLTVTGSNIQPNARSALRIWHCQQVSVTNNTLGGNGTYVAFLFKCSDVAFTGNAVFHSQERGISFKGIFHGTQSIFSAIPVATYGVVPWDVRFAGNSFYGKKSDVAGGTTNDAIGGQNPTDPLLDPVGSQGGAPIGFTKQDWRGTGRGFSVTGNTFWNSQAYGTAMMMGGNTDGVFFASNTLHNALVNIRGARNISITHNAFTSTLPSDNNISFSYDSALSVSPSGFVCSYNIFTNPEGVGIGSGAAISCRAVEGVVAHNAIWKPRTNIEKGIVLWSESKNVQAYGNTLYKDASSEVAVVVLVDAGINTKKSLNATVDTVAETSSFVAGVTNVSSYTTAQRNGLKVVGADIGATVFDSTLNKPVWLKAYAATADTAFVAGKGYTIQTLGTTNWTAIGASSAAVGVSFVKNATAVTGAGGAAYLRDWVDSSGASV